MVICLIILQTHNVMGPDVFYRDLTLLRLGCQVRSSGSS